MLPGTMLLLAAASATPAPSWAAVATEVVSALTLPSVKGFDFTQDVAVSVHAGTSADIRRQLNARVRGHLVQLGLPHPTAVPSTEALSEARAAGAEWLLRITLPQPPSEDGVAELLWIEPEGLWGLAPESPPSLALVSFTVPSRAEPAPVPSPEVPPPAPEPAPEPAARRPLQLAGPPLKARTMPDAVLGLATCAQEGGAAVLAVLTHDTLHLVQIEAGSIKEAAQLDLQPLPRALLKTRDLVGQVVCGQGRLGFSHVGLQYGYEISLSNPTGPWRPLAGQPLGFDAHGGVLLGTRAPGSNRLEGAPQWLTSEGASIEAQGEWPPALHRTWSPDLEPLPAGHSLDVQHRWHGLSAEAPVRCGYGATVHPWGAQPLLICPGMDYGDPQDSLRLIDIESGRATGPPVPLPGPVQSTALVPGPEQRPFVVVAVQSTTGGSDLYLVAAREAP